MSIYIYDNFVWKYVEGVYLDLPLGCMSMTERLLIKALQAIFSDNPIIFRPPLVLSGGLQPPALPEATPLIRRMNREKCQQITHSRGIPAERQNELENGDPC